MHPSFLKKWFLVFGILLSLSLEGSANEQFDGGHIKVTMRMIGHRILSNFGDSTSRVLPITNKGDAYLIEFASEFGFEPNDFVKTINGVVAKSKLPKHYLVEVLRCSDQKVVYSYEVGGETNSDIIPCGSRGVEKACYSILFNPKKDTLVSNYLQDEKENMSVKSQSKGKFKKAYLLIPLFLFVGWGVYSRRKKNVPDTKSQMIKLGKYLFDKNSMKLIFNHEKIELTSKEAELLFLLYESLNTTIKREIILEKVWGDEGDYVGRTLDVFISKLRKKLEADPNVKIANIRGVGYRLILEK